MHFIQDIVNFQDSFLLETTKLPTLESLGGRTISDPQRNSWWSSQWLSQIRNSSHTVTLPVAVLGWNVPDTVSLCASPIYTPVPMIIWGTPSQVLGQSVIHRKMWSLYHEMVQLLFSSSFFIFLSRQHNAFEQHSHSIIISANALFQRDFNLDTKKEKAMSFPH